MKKLAGVALLAVCITAMAALHSPLYADARESAGAATSKDVAKQLQNPVADIYTVPFENDFLYNLGPRESGYLYKLVLQPVVSLTLNDDWLLVLRPILTQMSQRDVFDDTTQQGLGDTELEPFLSPKKAGKVLWGIGPILLLPTAALPQLGAGKWGIGPNGVVLVQPDPWTIGVLANQTWSYAGDARRSDVSLTYMQPFISYTLARGSSVGISSESSYNWESDSWTVPIIGDVSQVLPFFFHEYISISLAGMYYPVPSRNSPEWGTRVTLTFIFLKH